MASPERYRVYAMLNFVGVPLTHALGYTPGWVGLGKDMPKDVFLQWAGWVMSPRYLFDPELPGLSNFAKYKGALRALCFSDDPWATRAGGGVAVFRIHGDQARDPHGDAVRRRRQKDRPFRLLPPRAPRHAVARRGGMDAGGVEAVPKCSVILRCALLRASKDDGPPVAILLRCAPMCKCSAWVALR